MNLFKKNNNEIESLTAQINELQSRIKEQNQTIEELTGDRDYWKSQYEELSETFDSEAAKIGTEIRTWVARKMLKNMQDASQVEKLKKRVDNATPEEVANIFEKVTTVKVENVFLKELGELILKAVNLD